MTIQLSKIQRKLLMSLIIFFNLARGIRDVDQNYDFAFNSNNSMFLGGVCESDVLKVVQKFKSKKSTQKIVCKTDWIILWRNMSY